MRYAMQAIPIGRYPSALKQKAPSVNALPLHLFRRGNAQ